MHFTMAITWFPDGNAVFSAVSAACSIVAAITAVWALVAAYHQLHGIREQLKLANFGEYTNRYRAILEKLPESIHTDGFRLWTADADRDPERVKAFRMYFDLCFEEYWLFQQGLLPVEIWNLWKDGIRTAMARTAFQQAWEYVSKTSKYGDSFERFIMGRAG